MTKKLPQEEKELLKSYERGEWKSSKLSTGSLKKYSHYATETVLKDKRVNIRISSRLLEILQLKALEEGIPYQTLISSILHKFATGRLKEAR